MTNPTLREPAVMPARRKVSVFLALVALVFSVAACSGSEGASSAKGDRIVAAIDSDPQTIDQMQSSTALTSAIGQNVFENLFARDKTYAPQPMLAESFKTSEDGLTYTILLRKDVKFSNGEAMTADDVVASLIRWSKVSTTGLQVAGDGAEFKAADDYTVEITLDKPRYSLISDLAHYTQAASIMPAEIAKAAGMKPVADADIIGTGPYKLKKYQHGQSIILEKNENYSPRSETKWGGDAGKKVAKTAEIEFRFVSDPAQQLNGLKSGQFHWASAVSNDELANLKKDPNLTYALQKKSYIDTILLNLNEGSVFHSPDARRAMNMLIDKKAMADIAYGSGKELWGPLGGAFVGKDNKQMYSDAGQDVYENYDPAEAKKLFASVGYTSGKTIRIMTSKTYPFMYQMAVVMQAELKKIGLKADVQVFDFPTLSEKRGAGTGDWDITMTFLSGVVTSPAQLLPLDGTWVGGAGSPEVAALLAKYSASKTPEEAHSVVEELQQYVWDDVPFISITPRHPFVAYSKKIKDLTDFNAGIFWNATIDS